MSEANDRQTWESLWDDLGLPSESAAPAKAPEKIVPARPTPAPQEYHEPKVVVIPPVDMPVQAESPEAVASPEPAPARGREPQERGGRRRGRGGRPAERTAPPSEPRLEKAPEVVSAEDSDEMPSVVTSGDESEEGPSEENRGERRGRRRRRRRRPDEREPVAATAVEAPEAPELVEEEETVVETVDDPESGDEDDLSNWNIMPWQDLIASLYRPER